MKNQISYILILFVLGLSSAYSQSIDSLNNLLTETIEPKKKIDIYLKLSTEFQKTNTDYAKELVEKGLNLAKLSGTDVFNGKLYRSLGDIYIKQDSMELAEKYFLIASDYFLKNQEVEDLTMVKNVLGNIQFMRGRYVEAMEYYMEAIAMAKELGLNNILAPLYHNIGAINVNSRKEYSEAIKNFSIALKLFTEAGDSTNMATTYKNIGDTYFQLGDTIQSSEYYQQASKLFKKGKNNIGLAQVNMGMGAIAYKGRNFKKSLKLLMDADHMLSQFDSHSTPPPSTLISNNYVAIADNYLALGELQNALVYYRNARKYGLHNNQINILAQTSKGLSDVWSNLNNSDSAFMWFKEYKSYSDSLLNEERIRKLAFQDAQFRYEEKLNKEQQESLMRVEKERINYLILALIILALTTAIIVLFLILKLWRSRLKRSALEQKKLKSELETRNKELTTFVMYQVRNNEFIINITQKMKSIVMRMKTENKPLMEEIIHELEHDTTNFTWKDFETRFHGVHTDFNKKLLESYPDLSPNELRLCAFLRLNLTTKEISAITYQSVNSIDTARSRLRHKLGLTKDDKLVAELMKY